MQKLRWVTDAGSWDVDVSTPATLDGVAKPIPDGCCLPLGLSRGLTLSRPKQLDFFHRFMSLPLVPSYAGSPESGGDGVTLQRAITFPFGEKWFAAISGQFNMQKFLSAVKEKGKQIPMEPIGPKKIWRSLGDKSLYALNFCSEFLITPSGSLQLSTEMHNDNKGRWSKALFHYKFPLHNLLLEMTWPKLLVDKAGTYWEVPMSMAVDVASVPSDSGLSYHLCVDHTSGLPKQLGGVERNVDIWRKKNGKVKMVQPYDVFLTEPHVAASGRIGGIFSGYFGGSSTVTRLKEMLKNKNLGFHAKRTNSLLSVDAFASLSCTVQCGNFQRLFMDLTRLSACMEISSGASLVSGVTHLLDDLYRKKRIDVEAISVAFPHIVFSFQQQIVGPFSFRVDSTVMLEPRNGSCVPRVCDSVYALEYALQVLGSAKAVAWYSTKQREAMIELRFFEH
ncbi:unnamed protein product [Victoria cruziana]